MAPVSRPFTIAIVVDEIIVAGVALCSIDMAHALATLGYEVTLVILRNSGTRMRWRQRFTTIILDPPSSLQSLTKILNQFDAVIVSNGASMPFAFEAARHSSKPLLVEWLHHEFKARQCPAVDIAIGVSETIYRSMSPEDVDLYIPNGIDCRRFYPRDNRASGLVRIIQIAREWKTMDPDLAVLGQDLVKRGLPVEIHIVGKEGTSSPQIIFHGVTRDVTALLQNADILLHMPQAEPFGMPAIEAMACRVIPIVSNTGGLPISVIHGVTGYVAEFGDRKGVENILTDLVLRIARNDPGVSAMRDAAIRRVRDHFDILATARQIGSYLEQMAGKLPRKHRSSQYPFSFVGPMLDYSLNRTDHYLAAMADVTNAPDLTEALGVWRQFRSHPEPEWRNVSQETWSFLDGVYSRLAADSASTENQRNAVGYYWLALLALSLRCYEDSLRFLELGCLRPPSNDQALSEPAQNALVCSIAIFLLLFYRADLPPQLAEAETRIREFYYRNRIEYLDEWKLDSSLLKKLLEAAQHSEILPLLWESEK